MSEPHFRPNYVSFDCYGTLISWPMTPITKELVGDQVPTDKWDQFVAEFRGYRYDQVWVSTTPTTRCCRTPSTGSAASGGSSRTPPRGSVSPTA